MRKAKTDGEILELYDGQMALASRRLISDNIPELKYTAQGRELYALSESLYGEWLDGGRAPSLVERAVELCRRAVKLGFPPAVVRMAFFYDKDYISADRTEEFRCRVACDYYGKIVYEDAVPKAEANYGETGWEQLKRQAARMLLDMLAGTEEMGKFSDGKYSFSYHSSRIRDKLGILPETERTARGTRDGEKLATAVFDSCKFNKSRAPLFGIMSLTVPEVKSLFAARGRVMKLVGDLNIWIDCGEKTVKAGNTSAFSSFINSLEGESVLVYFFNNNLGGHRYLSGNQRKTLCDAMLKDNHLRFARLARCLEVQGKSEYLFSDDDVYFFMTGRLTSLKTALDALLDRVENDVEWSET